MSRIRLTTKTRIANDPADMEGNRQDCGKKSRMMKYNNFDPAKEDIGGLGDKKTDGSQLHEEDIKGRNEMNIGEIKLRQAKAWQASKLATKLAIYLLGEKAPSSMVKAQAADFLSLGNAKLAKAVNRFAKTEYLYADEEIEQEVKEAPKAEATEEVEEACGDVASEQEVKEAPKAEATEEVEEAPKAEEVKQEVKEAPKAEEVKQEDAIVEEQVQDVQKEDDQEIDDACLASLFEQNSNNLVASKKVASVAKKVGVQKLSQPQVKVASNKSVNLEDIWESAPDVSRIFN